MSSFDERVNEALGIVGRLVAFTGIALLVVFVAGIALKPVFPDGVPPGQEGRILIALIVGFALVIAHVAVVPLLERSDWSVTGFHGRGWHPAGLAVALAAGALPILAAGGTLRALGHLGTVAAPAGEWLPWAAGILGVLALLGALEELIFRGYLFGLLLSRWGRATALLVTTVMFAAMHARDAGATLTSVGAFLAMGLMLGAVRSATGSTVAAWLAHTAIRWVQAAIFRLPLGGAEIAPAPGFRLELDGPAWLTGGAWGLEGSALATVGFLLISFLLLNRRAPAAGRAHHRQHA